MTPADDNFEIKKAAVLKSYVDRIMAATDENDFDKYILKLYKKGEGFEDFKITPESFSVAQGAANTIGFRPKKHIAEEIFDLSLF